MIPVVRNYEWLYPAGLIGMVLFLFLMPQTHPPSFLSRLSDTEEVKETSRLFLEHSGYQLENLESFATFQSNNELIRKQIAHFGKNRFNDFIKNGFLRFIPSYYWQVVWIKTDDTDRPDELSISSSNYKQPVGIVYFKTRHSTDGALLEFEIADALALEAKTASIPETKPSVGDVFTTGEQLSETKSHAILRTSVKHSVWDNHAMRMDSVFLSEIFNSQTTTVRLRPEADIFGHRTQVDLALSEEGRLLGMNQYTTIPESEKPESGEALSVSRIIVYVFGVFLLISLFFRRLFQRLIDLRSSTIYGVTAFGISLLFIAHTLFQVSAFEQIDIQILQVIMMATISILLAGIAGILVFVLSALGESLTREIWPEKLSTLTMLRLGYFREKNVGRSIVTGVLASMMYLGIVSVCYYLFDSSYFNPLGDQFFYSETYLISYWQVLVVGMFWMFLISAGLYSNLISWTAIIKDHQLLLLLVGGILFSLISSLHIESANQLSIFLFGFFPGLAVTRVFLKHDLLTLFVSIFFFVTVWITAEGWLVSGSPDGPLSLSVFLLMGLTGITGLYIVFYGNDQEHIPELTPRYISEIAREQRVQRELEIAHHVHQSFLPVNLPRLDGFEIAANCHAAFDVGGDYYDVIPLDDHRTAFVIGDVSGKGIQAAFYMTMVKGIFHSLVKEMPQPKPLLTRLNQLFYANARRGSFISVCYGLIDNRSGKVTYARAGHNPAILVNAENGKASILRSDGLAIGLTDTPKFKDMLTEMELTLDPGDTLIFYTDGFPEATSPGGEMFGEDRLITEIENAGQIAPDSLIETLNHSITRFTAGTAVGDDMTVVVVQRTKKEPAISK
ncbi:PP2C family protein-serine/threonine phosphatase [Balneolales bacterium ANBcel1]|nr:PP2C family protein-serine/threonine phosphatase [Balneolales bacterium ANBcel1]